MDNLNHCTPALEPEPPIDLAKALEQSNTLIKTLAYTLPQLIFVLVDGDRQVLFSNYAASVLTSGNPHFLHELRNTCIQNAATLQAGSAIKFIYRSSERRKTHYSVSSYPIVWNGKRAQIRILNEVRPQNEDPDDRATPHQDRLTRLDNRLAGIMTLNKWLDQKLRFSLCVANLDNLQYVNRSYGREEGDQYIRAAAEQLAQFAVGAKVSRSSGDEFLILALGFSEVQTEARMTQLSRQMQQEVAEKPYYSSISYGAVEVGENNERSASELLAIADERMCLAKLESKRNRSFIV